jgi:hypothetical protein
MNYRKIWESYHGKIPVDLNGVTFDIHHIDGNRKNNDINNLMCVSIYDHYKIHLNQFNETKSHKERAALNFLKSRIKKIENGELKGHMVTEETRNKIRNKLKGKKRPKYIGEIIKKRFTGYKWSDAAIENRRAGLIEYHKNKSIDVENKWKANISKSHIGKTHNEKTKLKLAKFNSKLTDTEVIEIDKMIKSKISYKIISEKYNISPSQITQIKQRNTYYWINLD